MGVKLGEPGLGSAMILCFPPLFFPLLFCPVLVLLFHCPLTRDKVLLCCLGRADAGSDPLGTKVKITLDRWIVGPTLSNKFICRTVVPLWTEINLALGPIQMLKIVFNEGDPDVVFNL